MKIIPGEYLVFCNIIIYFKQSSALIGTPWWRTIVKQRSINRFPTSSLFNITGFQTDNMRDLYSVQIERKEKKKKNARPQSFRDLGGPRSLYRMYTGLYLSLWSPLYSTSACLGMISMCKKRLHHIEHIYLLLTRNAISTRILKQWT